MKLDYNIYGCDENAFAQAVSADALDVEKPGVNIANHFGDVLDQKGSHGALKHDKAGSGGDSGKLKAEWVGKGDDGVSTKGNHGKQG